MNEKNHTQVSRANATFADVLRFQQDSLVAIETLSKRKQKILRHLVHKRFKTLGENVASVQENRYLVKKYHSQYDCRNTRVCRAGGSMDSRIVASKLAEHLPPRFAGCDVHNSSTFDNFTTSHVHLPTAQIRHLAEPCSASWVKTLSTLDTSKTIPEKLIEKKDL